MTIVVGDKYEAIWKKTEPYFLAYADKCDADLIILNDVSQVPTAHWLKFCCYDLLKKEYDRIAYIDADIIIRDDAPSLFDIVPENEFGIFNEGEFTPRNICIHEVMKVYQIEGFRYDGTTYYNTGVFVCSRRHRHIFKIVEEVKQLRNSFGEQTFLNMKIMLSGEKIFKLHYKFNRMSIMDRATGVSRLDSYLIHYAGDGDNMMKKMDRDIIKWKEANGKYEYKKKIFIWSLGGIGDVVSAEPVIRYIREKAYKDCEIWLMCKDYEIYDHIEGIHFSKGYPDGDFDAVIEMNTHQLPWESFGKAISFHFMHPVDWVSTCMLGRQLSDDDKQIKLTFAQEHMAEVTKIYNEPEELVLVHPGVGWESKTFPVEYWQKIIDGLIESGQKVGIIGKRLNDAHSVLEVDATHCIDFRDKLSLRGLVALISMAKTLISNDSAPIHIAGAFDNNILLIPTCKHPDHVLPFRNRSKNYKAKALYKKLMEEENSYFGGDITDVWVAKYVPKGHSIVEYLPEPEEVIETVLEFDESCEQSQYSYRPMEGYYDFFMESYERGHAV
ncbi:MAG: glycosyltransferase family 9 protein [Clostridia bacterium]